MYICCLYNINNILCILYMYLTYIYIQLYNIIYILCTYIYIHIYIYTYHYLSYSMNKGIWSALGQYQRHSCSLMDLGPGMSSTGYAAKTLRYTAGLQCNCRHGLMVVDGWCCALTEKWMWNTLRSQHRKGGTSLQKNFWALKLFPRTERTSPSANCAFEITCFFFFACIFKHHAHISSWFRWIFEIP